MEVEFLINHTLQENRKSYKKGDTQKVSSSISKRLVDGGIAKPTKIDSNQDDSTL